ncbi:MAG: TraR/DksA family transcriptional regulator [Acidobacteria bacterium]|nr:TraR/DksA family transcriptional regulator [Acidobacteriota bacterium]
MTAEQLQEFRDLLEVTLAELRASLNASTAAAAPVSPDNAIGRLTRQDAMQAQQMALEVRRRNQARLQQVEAAIRKLESGDYGICVRCEEEISLARLRVRPEARVCVRCAQGG